MVNIIRLKNGIRLALDEIPYVRSISMGIWVRNGSRNETAANNGISHFIEHMMFKGTERRQARDIAEEMDGVGGQINAYTTKEYTCYYTRVLDKHFDIALDILSDMFLNSKFDDADIEKERNIILEEINMYRDSPEELVHDALSEAVWGKSPLSYPILGTKESIASFDRRMLRDYVKNNYTPDNIVISIAGNISEDEALSRIEAAFGGLEPTGTTGEAAGAEYNPSIAVNKKDVEQLHVCIAFNGFRRDTEDKYPLSVLNTIFGGGMSSRLFQKIREDNGLTYSIYSYISSYTDCGLFSIYAGMSNNQADRVAELITEEIRRILKEGIPQRTVDITKEQIISNYIIGTESTANRMTSAGGSVLLRGRVQTPEEIISEIEKITPEDIGAVAAKIFNGNAVSLSAAGNTQGIDFDKMLEKIRNGV